MRMKHWQLAFQVGATYIGTVVGAGFASGQEIVQFFTMFGSKGLVGIIIAGLMFCWLGTKILSISHRIAAQSYQDVVLHVCGNRLGAVFNAFISIILLGGLCVMFAGTGSISAYYLGLPFNAGVAVTVVLSIVTVNWGIRGIMLANSIIVPILIMVACAVSMLSLAHHGISADLLHIPAHRNAFTPYWLLSPLLYVAYNMTLALTLLAPMGGAIRNRRTLLWGGCMGGAGLGALAFLIVVVTLVHYPATTDVEIPMLYITRAQGLYAMAPYVLVLWAEMFTTAIASLYGFAQIANRWTGIGFPYVVCTTACIAVVGSQWGFANLVNILYPLFGYLSLVFIIALSLTRK
jgi:uncharacterized membrane protein YkvI